MADATPPRFKMTLSLSVLKHLGFHLYSNVPAVIAEAVSNSWDADASRVSVTFDLQVGTIEVADDGHGMSEADVNAKYLTVGYERRNRDGARTLQGREVMGRKGIGKLSLFSIADIIEVHTCDRNGTSAFRMSRTEIEATVRNKSSADYHPAPIENCLQHTPGTLIRLSELRKRVTKQSQEALRTRLARRFSVIGPSHNFDVEVDGTPIRLNDRDYFHKLQFVWWLGPRITPYADACSNVTEEGHFELPNVVSGEGEKKWTVGGWIGSVERPAQLKDADDTRLNRISIMVRGKLAQEDVLSTIASSKLYSNYLIGEVYADYLDADDFEDIATSNRQSLVEDDERYVALRGYLRAQLSAVESTWAELRKQKGTEQALRYKSVEKWYKTLTAGARKQAETLFAKIATVANTEDEERLLLKHGVLAFETLRQRDKLEELDALAADDIRGFVRVFDDLNQIEAASYHQIVAERIRVIERLQDLVEENSLEKVLQELLFENLWLLDPAWERATGTEFKEQTVTTALKTSVNLSKKEAEGRLDIGYREVGGTHVIVELKRADRVLETGQLITQIRKYKNAVRKAVEAAEGPEGGLVSVVIVVGCALEDWTDARARAESVNTFATNNARVRTYQQLLESAHRAYSDFFKARSTAGVLSAVMKELEKTGSSS